MSTIAAPLSGRSEFVDLATVSHDGKVVVVGTDRAGLLHYTVRQSGFEDSAVTPVAEQSMPGFEPWSEMPLDRSTDDPSVVAFEAANLTTDDGGYLMKSIYGSAARRSSPARVKLLSCLDHLYLFRVSADNRLLLNRFVLDGIANELVPKLEVRFHRSEQKLEPEGGIAGSGAVALDTLAYRNTKQESFFEPAKELTFLGTFDDGKPWFSVELLPTDEHERHRWSFFVYTGGKLRLISVAASLDGLLDLSDQRRVQPDPDNVDRKVAITVPGITERVISLPGAILNGFDSTVYHNQVARMTKAGEQLLKESTRVMLTVPVADPAVNRPTPVVAAVSFKVNNLGLLSQIDRSGTDALLLGKAKEVLLPPTDLDEIKLIADGTPPPRGDVASLTESRTGRVQVTPSESASGSVTTGQDVRVWGTRSYDGTFVAHKVDADGGTFEIQAADAAIPAEPLIQGHWEVIDDDSSGLVFENMIAGYEYTEDGRLRITCVSHNLSEGDEIRIEGTTDHDGTFPITAVDDDNSFVIDQLWPRAEVVNLSIRPRRGLAFDGSDDYLVAGPINLDPFEVRQRVERTVSAWVQLDAVSGNGATIVSCSSGIVNLSVNSEGRLVLRCNFADGHSEELVDEEPLPVGVWVHVVGMIDFRGDRDGATTLRLMRAGMEVASLLAPPLKPLHLTWRNLRLATAALPVATLNYTLPPTQQLTVEAWVNPTESGRGIVASWFDAEDVVMAVDGPAEQRHVEWQVGDGVVVGSTHLTPGEWHHLAGTYDPDTGRQAVYLNGVLEGETSTGRTFSGRSVYVSDAERFQKPFTFAALGAGLAEQSATVDDVVHIEIDESTNGDWWKRIGPTSWIHVDENGTQTDSFEEIKRRDGWIEIKSTDDAGYQFDLNPAHPTVSRVDYNAEVESGAWEPMAPGTSTADVAEFTWLHEGRVAHHFRRTSLSTWELHVGSSVQYFQEFRRDSRGFRLKNVTPMGEMMHQLNRFAIDTQRSIESALEDVEDLLKDVASRINDSFKTGRVGSQPAQPQPERPQMTPPPFLEHLYVLISPDTLFLRGQELGPITNVLRRRSAPTGDMTSLADVDLDDGRTWSLQNPDRLVWAELTSSGTRGFYSEVERTNASGSEPGRISLRSVDETHTVTFTSDASSGNSWSRVDDEVVTQLGTDVAAYNLTPGFASEDRFQGFLADVRFWGVVRTAEELEENKHLSLTGSEPGLLGYWLLGPTAANEASDLTPTKAHLDLSQLAERERDGSGLEAMADCWLPTPHRAPGYAGLYGAGQYREFYALAADVGNPTVVDRANGLQSEGMPIDTLRGKLSEVEVWDVNPEVDSIRESMHRQRTGTEYGLANYWRCSGIMADPAPGSEGRITPDLAIDGVDAVVVGDVYVSACELARRNSAGLGVRYSNDDLVAVTQGATYRESFEFRAVSFNGDLWTLDDVNDADGLGNPIFKVRFWGQEHRTSTQRVEVSSAAVRQSDFVVANPSRTDGWIRVEAEVTIPNDVNLLRCFEIDEVRGLATGRDLPSDEWASLSVRRHTIRLISDSVTKASYQDDLGDLEALRGDDGDLGRDATDLPTLERTEAAMRAEIDDLTEQLLWIEQRDRLVARRSKALVAQQRATAEQRAAADARTAFVKDPFNRVLTLVCVGTGRAINDGGQSLTVKAGRQADALAWVIEQNPDKTYTIRTLGSGRYLIVADKSFTIQRSEDERALGFLWKTGTRRWTTQHVYKDFVQLSDDPVAGSSWQLIDNGAGYWTLFNVSAKVKLRVGLGGVSLFGIFSDALAASAGQTNILNTWRLAPVGDERPTWYPAELAKFDRGVERTERKLRDLNSEISWLDEVLAIGPGGKAEIQARLQQLRTSHNQLASTVDRINDDALLQQSMSTKRTMSLIAEDTLGLKTFGALLTEASPSGAVTTAATAEGNVQLSYFDTAGRARFTDYDATSDSTNSSFEQWLGRQAPLCPNVAAPSARLNLEKPLSLPRAGHTIEAWFYYPPPAQGTDRPAGIAPGDDDLQPYRLSFLTSDADGTEAAIAIANGCRLGTVVDGYFHDVGVDLDNSLERGWHHVAVASEAAATRFYLDGRPVGNETGPVTRFVLDPANRIGFEPELRTIGETKSITFACWIRPDRTDAPRKRLFGINTYVVVLAGSKVQVLDAANIHQTPLSTGESLSVGRWTHVAVTIDNGLITCYLDGREAGRGELSPVPAFQELRLSLARKTAIFEAFTGALGDTQLWRSALSASEIGDYMYQPPSADDPNLLGHWPMSVVELDGGQTVLMDMKEQERNVEPWYLRPVAGTWTISSRQLDPTLTRPISVCGNSGKGGAPIGRLAHLRFWSVALPDEEVLINSMIELTGNEPDLFACFPLDDLGGTSQRSVSLTGTNSLTLSGARKVVRTVPIGHPRIPVASFSPGSANPITIDNFDLGERFSIEFWMRFERSHGRETLVMRGIGTNVGGRLSIQKNSGPSGDTLEVQWKDITRSVSLGVRAANRWIHVACVFDGSTTPPEVFIDGIHRQSTVVTRPQIMVRTGNIRLGGNASDGVFRGQMAEFRVWGPDRRAADIAKLWNRRATGDEDGLRLCLPLDDPFGKEPVRNRGSEGTPSIAIAAGQLRSITTDALPLVPGNSLVTAEYSTVGLDPLRADVQRALLRRFYSFVDSGGSINLLPGKRIEELVLKWIGNAQFEPTLLGYIEGAPPVPSENLTIDYDYDGATMVELRMSDEIEYSWNRSTDVGGGLDINAFLGAGWGVEGGIGIVTKMSEGHAGVRGTVNVDWRREASTTIRARSTSTARDELELRGEFEIDPRFPHLGNRYVPKNVGYALVISGMADVYVTQMKRTGRMVAYDVRPCEDMPPDVNTITFLINPAYSLNGSLDGLVGSHAADDRFYRHVPAMRSQHGSRYPASYFNMKQAYDLKRQIERWDKDREAYFAAFDSQNVMGLDEGMLNQIPEDGEDTGSRLAELAEGSDTPSGPVDENDKRSDAERQEEQKEALRKKFEKNKDKQEEEAKKRVDDIERRFADNDKKAEATAAFETWQRKMENLQLRAAKRNIQNTYVWDADGGVRFEEESFANTIEHTIGGSFSLNASLGLDVNAQIGAFKGELQAMATLAMSQTLTKTRSSTRSFELNVRLDRVERKGITGADDLPVHPGEKVDRYRFMSFYLEGDTNHFNDFFAYVVDPEWFMSNDEEARALRQIARGRPNKTWRVLHRVTYVERPALMGFGRDQRVADDLETAATEVHNYFDALEADNDELRTQIGELAAQIKAMERTLASLAPAAPSEPRQPQDAPEPTDDDPVDEVGSAASVPRDDGLIDVNTATFGELEDLTGIGPVMALAIMNYREATGGFTTLAELTNISGIGPSLLQRLRPQLAPLDGDE